MKTIIPFITHKGRQFNNRDFVVYIWNEIGEVQNGMLV